VEAYLEDMARRSAGALAVKLPRQPGARESRWAHLLSGPVETATAAPHAAETPAGDDLAALRSELAQLREEVAELRALIARLRQPPPAGE
jgi:uncharacterized protein YceH (UPF0502 family)